MVPKFHPSLPFNWHLEQFSHFCRAQECHQQTDRSRYNLALAVMWPKNDLNVMQIYSAYCGVNKKLLYFVFYANILYRINSWKSRVLNNSILSLHKQRTN